MNDGTAKLEFAIQLAALVGAMYGLNSCEEPGTIWYQVCEDELVSRLLMLR